LRKTIFEAGSLLPDCNYLLFSSLSTHNLISRAESGCLGVGWEEKRVKGKLLHFRKSNLHPLASPLSQPFFSLQNVIPTPEVDPKDLHCSKHDLKPNETKEHHSREQVEPSPSSCLEQTTLSSLSQPANAQLPHFL